MKHILKKVIAIATVVTMLAAVPAMDAQAAVVKYATYTNTRFTYTVKYPTTFQRSMCPYGRIHTNIYLRNMQYNNYF